jgi:hypothetical protein
VKKQTGQVPWLNLEASLDKYYLWRQSSTGNPPPVVEEPSKEGQVVSAMQLARKVSTSSRPLPPLSADSRLTPVALESLMAVGDALGIKGQLADATMLYDWAVRLAPGSPEAHARRAAAYFAAGRDDEAMKEKELADGQPLPFIVREDVALKEDDAVKGKVSKGWTAYVDRINGERLWVKSTREDPSLSGWLAKAAIMDRNLRDSASVSSSGLAGTIWETSDSDGDRMLLMFGNGDSLYYLSDRGFGAGATWHLEGDDGPLRITINATTLEGRKTGDIFRGTGPAASGWTWTWEAKRQ